MSNELTYLSPFRAGLFHQAVLQVTGHDPVSLIKTGDEVSIVLSGEATPVLEADILEATAALNLLDLIAKAKEQVVEFAESIRMEIAGNPSHLETAAWAAKQARAERYVGGQATQVDISILEAEVYARQRGETVTDLVEKQLLRAAQFATADAQISGMSQAAFDALDTATPDTIPAILSALTAQAELAKEALLAQVT